MADVRNGYEVQDEFVGPPTREEYTTQRAKSFAQLSEDIDPDEANEVIKLAKPLGANPEVVAEDKKPWHEALSGSTYLMTHYQGYPAYLKQQELESKAAKEVQDRYEMAVAKGTLPAMSTAERVAGYTHQQAKVGYAQAKSAELIFKGAFGELSDDEFSRLGEYERTITDSHKWNQFGLGTLGKTLGDTAYVVAQNVPWLQHLGKQIWNAQTFGEAKRLYGDQYDFESPWKAIPGGMAYVMEFSDTYQKALQSGASKEEAVGTATVAGAISAALEFADVATLMQGGRLLKMAVSKKGAASVVKGTARSAGVKNALLEIGRTAAALGVQPAQEYAQGLVKDAAIALRHEGNTTAEDVILSVARSDLEANRRAEAKMALSATAIPFALGAGVSIHANVRAARHSVAVRDQLRQDASDSQRDDLAKKNKELYSRMVSARYKGTPMEELFIPLDQWDEFWIKNDRDPAVEARRIMGSDKPYHEARKAGTDLVMPNMSYVEQVTLSPEAEGLAEITKTSEEAMTPQEAEEYLKKTQPLVGIVMGTEDMGWGKEEAEMKVEGPVGKNVSPIERERMLPVGEGIAASDLAALGEEEMRRRFYIQSDEARSAAQTEATAADEGTETDPTDLLYKTADATARSLFAGEPTTEATEKVHERGKDKGKPYVSEAKFFGMGEASAERHAQALEDDRNAARLEYTERRARRIAGPMRARWNARYDENLNVAEQQVFQLPQYVALNRLQRGTYPDGSKAPGSIKIGAKYVDKAVADTLPRGTVVQRGGQHPDAVAPLFGFDSGDALLKALSGLRPMTEEIAVRAKQLTIDQIGERVSWQDMMQDAVAAIHNDKHIYRLQFEYEHFGTEEFRKFSGLQRALFIKKRPAKVVIAEARADIGEMKLRDVRPAAYLAAERRESNNVVEAAMQNRWENAAEAKRREVEAAARYRVSTEAREATLDNVANLARFKRKAVRERVGKGGLGILDQITRLVESVGIAKRQPDMDRETLAQFEARLWEERGIGIVVPIALRFANSVDNVQDATVDQIAAVNFVVTQLENIARKELSIATEEGEIAFDIVRDLVVEDIKQNSARLEKIPHVIETDQEHRAAMAAGFDAVHKKMLTMLFDMGGRNPASAIMRFLYRPLDRADAVEQMKNEESRNVLSQVFGEYTDAEKHELFTEKIYVPEIKQSLTKIAIMMVGAHEGNAYGRHVIRAGFKWSEAQKKAVLEYLDERDWHAVAKLRDAATFRWDEAADMIERQTGIRPDKVVGDGVYTKYGTQKGGYMTVSYPRRLYPELGIDPEKGRGRGAFAMVNHAYLKPREGSADRMVDLSLSVPAAHMKQVDHDVTHRVPVMQVRKLLLDQEVASAIKNATSVKHYRELLRWLDDVASGPRALDDIPTVPGVLNYLQTSAAAVFLVGKISVAMLQPLGILLGATRMGPSAEGTLDMTKSAAFGLAKSFQVINQLGPKAAYDFMVSKDPTMGERVRGGTQFFHTRLLEANTENQEVRAILEIPGIRTRMFARGVQFIGIMQMFADLGTWHGTYHHALSGQVNGIREGDEQAAIEWARDAVKHTQGARNTVDLPAAQRIAWLRWFAQFYYYGSVTYQLLASGVNKIRNEKAFDQFIVAMAAIMASKVLERVIKRQLPDEPDDPEDWAWWLAMSGIDVTLSPILGGANAARALDMAFDMRKGKIVLKDPGASVGEFPVLGAATALTVGAAIGMHRTISKLTHPGKKLEFRDIRPLLEAGMIAGQVPGGGQMLQTAGYFYDVATGRIKPSGPFDFAYSTVVKPSYQRRKKSTGSSLLGGF